MATAGKVNGTIVKIQISNVAIEEQIEAAINFSRELIEFMNKDSGGYPDFEYGKASWDMSGKAHLTFDATTGYDTLVAALMAKTKLTVTFTTDVSGDFEFSGTMLIESLGMSTGTEDGIEFDYSFKGSGAPTKAIIEA